MINSAMFDSPPPPAEVITEHILDTILYVITKITSQQNLDKFLILLPREIDSKRKWPRVNSNYFPQIFQTEVGVNEFSNAR